MSEEELTPEKIIDDPEALEFGGDPRLLYNVKCDLDKRIAGENQNKLQLFKICCSSFTDNPLGAIITGESSAGKSWMLTQSLRYFRNVEEFTRVTAAAPDRYSKDFNHKILKIEELHGMEQAQAPLRILISEGRLRLLTVDPKTKETTVLETQGVPVFLTTTTNVEVDNELQNRLFILSIDESPEQTKKVLDFIAESYQDPDWEEKTAPDPKILKFVYWLEWTPFKRVKIPYAKTLAENFPLSTVKARRDFKKLLNLVYVSAFIHQLQRPLMVPKNVSSKLEFIRKAFIVATKEDLEIALKVGGESFKETFTSCQLRALQVLELFDNPNVELTVGEAIVKFAEKFNRELSTDRMRQILKSLSKVGFLNENDERKPYKYSLIKKPDFSRIEEIQAKISRIDRIQLENLFKDHVESGILEYQDIPQIYRRIYTPKPYYINPLTGEVEYFQIQDSTSPIKPKESRTNQIQQETSLKTPVRQEKPTISEIIEKRHELKQMLGEKFQDGDLLDLLETYNLTRKEAEEAMDLLYEQEIIARDPEGYLRWLK
jgi:predicted transcriptional regulator